MKFALILLCAAVPASAIGGTIEGTVVNTSTGAPVPCQVAVNLQVLVKGGFVPCREAISDKQGRFRFERLPLGDGVVYQAGATRHGIFYPGPRLRLTGLHPTARTELSVCDAVASPSPLVLKKMDITIRPETGLLKITESLLLENPSHTCYVGEAAHDGADPITLKLSIPPDFERTTFDLEFFGRRFSAVNNKVVTSIPWPPGERELRYTYVLRNTQKVSQWKRPMDLPCSNVTIRVEGMPPDEVRCELLGRATADEKTVVFASAGQKLPAGQILQVELGRLPLPWMTYGKWAAVAVMLVLIAGAGWLHFRRRHRQSPTQALPKHLTARNERKRAA
ncbi:MAG: hypothetical protein ABSG53_16650 [Thermoguttaceae bacterium]|jgi:hypothetical protein